MLPYYSRGTLRDFLDSKESDSKDIKNIFRGVAQALTFLHNNSVCHGDVKLENILLDDELKPILADFDTASDSSYVDLTMTSQSPGTLLYMAPELFERGFNNHNQTFEVFLIRL